MTTDALTAFIDALYGSRTHRQTVLDMCHGKYLFRDWAKELTRKRISFQSHVLNCCMHNAKDTLTGLTIIHGKFERSLYGYSRSTRFAQQYTLRDNKKEFLEQRYHENRRNEIALAKNFIDEIMQVYGVQSEKADSSIHYKMNLSDTKLEKIYNYLVENNHIERENLLPDFIYFFTGRGKNVNDGLKWKSDKVRLAYFIDTIIEECGSKEKKFWKKAEIIFGERGLGNKYNQALKKNIDNSQNEKITTDVRKLIK